MTTIDANACIDNLTREHPQLIEVLADLGFKDIKNPVNRATVGKIVTLRMGVNMKRMDPAKVQAELLSQGFEVMNLV